MRSRFRSNPAQSRDERKRVFARWLRQAVKGQPPIVEMWYTERFDSYDPYGSVMGEFFDVAELLSSETNLGTPRSWGYREGAGGSRSAERMAEETSELASEWLEGMWTDRDLLTLGNFLHQADEYVRRLTLDY